MRVSTPYQYDSLTNAINVANERMYTAQMAVSTGKSINKPSDNPFGTTSVLTMSSLRAGINQYNTNLNLAKGVLSYTDNALNEVATIANSAYTLADSGRLDRKSVV